MIRRLISALLLLAACTASADEPAFDSQSFDVIARGRYLALLGDCSACHTPPTGTAYAGGRAIETPFGMLLAPNITSDRATGIGGWTDTEFVDAVRHGIRRDGAHLYPAMPFTYYTKTSREDVLAIRAYLNTLPPVANRVAVNQLPFPFDMRIVMAVWDALFFKAELFTANTGKSPEWNRGAYIVEGLGHCGACHTAKNSLGGDRTSHALQGGLLQDWYAPELTSNPYTGIGSWSVEDMVTYLRTGSNRFAAATGPMSEVVQDLTSHLSEGDLKAIAVYLKDQPASDAKPSTALAPTDPAMRAGAAVFVDNCAACHHTDGTGVPQLFSALKGSPAVQSPDPNNLIRVVLQGAQSAATDRAPTSPAMPSFGWKLSDPQVASVLTYVRNSWGNAAPAISADTVRKLRGKLAARAAD